MNNNTSIFTITSGTVTASINSYGAELTSLKKSGSKFDYIWQGIPAIWRQRAPLLFPIVGRQINDSYKFSGKTYVMPQHGFAMNSDFTVTSFKENSISMELSSNEHTKAIYPFDFRLTSTFTVSYLTGIGILTVERQIENTGNSIMYYSIGEHPGYKIPMSQELNDYADDYYLEFSDYENLQRYYLDDEIIVGCEDYLHGRIIPITRTLFDRGALIFKNVCSSEISLCSKLHQRKVSVSLDGWNYLGIWAKPAAPYVCIEPWCGIASSKESPQELTLKEGILTLNPHTVRSHIMKVSFY